MGSALVCPNRTDIGCFLIFAKNHEERGRRVDEEMEQDEEMEEDSTSIVETVTGQGSFIAGTGNGKVREVRSSSKKKHATVKVTEDSLNRRIQAYDR